jgi:hypothetical protein
MKRPILSSFFVLPIITTNGLMLFSHCRWAGYLTTKIITLLEFFNFVSEVSLLQCEWSSDCWCIWKSLGVNACLQWRKYFHFIGEVFLYNFFLSTRICRGYFDCTYALAHQSLYAGIVYEHHCLCPGWPCERRRFKKETGIHLFTFYKNESEEGTFFYLPTFFHFQLFESIDENDPAKKHAAIYALSRCEPAKKNVPARNARQAAMMTTMITKTSTAIFQLHFFLICFFTR